MTPQEKAKELVHKMYMLDDPNGNYPMCFDIAKECALVAVEEVRFFHERLFYATEGSLFDDYLNKVKHEIEKL